MLVSYSFLDHRIIVTEEIAAVIGGKELFRPWIGVGYRCVGLGIKRAGGIVLAHRLIVRGGRLIRLEDIVDDFSILGDPRLVAADNSA